MDGHFITPVKCRNVKPQPTTVPHTWHTNNERLASATAAECKVVRFSASYERIRTSTEPNLLRDWAHHYAQFVTVRGRRARRGQSGCAPMTSAGRSGSRRQRHCHGRSPSRRPSHWRCERLPHDDGARVAAQCQHLAWRSSTQQRLVAGRSSPRAHASCGDVFVAFGWTAQHRGAVSKI